MHSRKGPFRLFKRLSRKADIYATWAVELFEFHDITESKRYSSHTTKRRLRIEV